MNLNCLIVAVFSMAAIILSSESSSEGGVSSIGRNCVDNCIVEFTAILNRPITFDDLDRAIEAGGFEINATYRSLADCIRILELLGIPVVAEYLTVGKYTDYPPHAIAYAPPPENRRIGHVVVLNYNGGDRLQIYDATKNAQRFSMSASDMNIQVNTIVLVTRSYVRYRALFRFLTLLCPVALIGCAGLWWLAPASKSNAQRIRSNLAAPFVLFFIAVSFSGCSKFASANQSVIGLEREKHDHGVINPENIGDSVRSEFVVRNNGSTSVKMSVSGNCSCVVAGVGSSGVDIAAGKSFILPVSVDIRSKVGAFREFVQLSFNDSNIPKRKLEINGLVSRAPLPSVDPLRMSALMDGEQAETLEIVYARTSKQQPAELESFHITASTIEIASMFLVGDVKKRVSNAFGGYPADTWSFPIRFSNNDGKFAEVPAQLELHWRNPPCVTYVQLLGATTPPLEIVPKVFFRGACVGVSCIQSVPVRVNSRNAVQNLKIVCPPQISCDFINADDRLLITILPDQIGEFRYSISVLLEETQVASLEVFGKAKHRDDEVCKVQ